MTVHKEFWKIYKIVEDHYRNYCDNRVITLLNKMKKIQEEKDELEEKLMEEFLNKYATEIKAREKEWRDLIKRSIDLRREVTRLHAFYHDGVEKTFENGALFAEYEHLLQWCFNKLEHHWRDEAALNDISCKIVPARLAYEKFQEERTKKKNEREITSRKYEKEMLDEYGPDWRKMTIWKRTCIDNMQSSIRAQRETERNRR